MPRIPRGDTTQSIYHVISRGVDRRPIFLNDEDRRYFLALLREAFRALDISVFAYCLMGNHYHVMLGTGDMPLSTAMHQLLMRYSIHFNGIHGRVGYLFESRYTAVPCITDRHLVRLISYIHLNPVRAGITESPGDWPWSSHSEFLNGDGDFLNLNRLSERTGYAVNELRATYAEELKFRSESANHEDLRAFIREIALSMGVDPALIFDGARGAYYTSVKRAITMRATAAGFSLCAIAKELGCSQSALSQLLNRRV